MKKVLYTIRRFNKRATPVRYWPAVIVLVLFGCISPLDIDVGPEQRILVVEGYISTEPGPFTVRVTKSAKYGSVFAGVEKLESGGEVWITDELGNPTFLIDMDYGLYQTPAGFTGQVGKTYVLHITTATGEKYASQPETISKVPAIDKVYYKFSKKPTSDPNAFILGADIFVDWVDPEAETNFYYWRNRGIYTVETYPENFVFRPPDNPFPGIPAPKSCCKNCWIREQSNEFRIRSDVRTNGTNNTQQVAFIEDDGFRFMERYKVTVRQFSTSKGAYEFLRLLQNQMSIDGDIFDPPPATIRGNMINLDDPDANVIGYFYASDVTSMDLYIDAVDLPETQPRKVIDDDCRTLRGATIFQPSDWN